MLMGQINRIACDAVGIEPQKVLPKRAAREARLISAYIGRVCERKVYRLIGRGLDCTDHTSVIYLVRTAAERAEEDFEFRDALGRAVSAYLEQKGAA